MNDYETTVLALARFVVENAPDGAERDLEVVRWDVDHDKPRPYISLEFRRERSSAHLYVEFDCLKHDGYDDEEGNRWHDYNVEAKVSWPSWGSDDVATCQARLALMTEVVRFAAAIQAKFPDVVRKLVSTKAERDARQTKARVERLIQANCKGMRVGQEKFIPSETDGGSRFVPIGAVEVTSTAADGSQRRYTTHVTGPEAFYFTRRA